MKFTDTNGKDIVDLEIIILKLDLKLNNIQTMLNESKDIINNLQRQLQEKNK